MNIRIDKKERNFQVLSHIIDLYVSTAIPVSSKSVTRKMDNTISSATVRNIMTELEDSGYIEQPHTSAGRIPTDSGYRHYVDFLKGRLWLKKREIERLAGEYTDRIKSIKDVIEKTSFLISRELHYAGVVMWPNIGSLYLKHLELVKIKAETVLAVLITMTNAVKNYIVKMNRDIGETELEKVANFVNMNYEGTGISRISTCLKDIVEAGADGTVLRVAGPAREIIDSVVEMDIENDIYCEGLDFFTGEPEFRDPDMTRHMLQIFSSRKEIGALMQKELPHKGVRVYIGKENKFSVFRECSIVTAGYELYGKPTGRIGVIGPTRMDYCNVLRTVSYLSELISSKLEELY
ncbi:MAG: heat-inducible transcription repressor HrcA [Candidatus Omnitrophica bacterium]|nr:heat-inducible transcription repressor HrcA [Candidatus Omnitrophota bacterium]